MPVVWIPALLRELTGGTETVTVPGATVRQVVTELDRLYPGLRDRLCEHDELRSGVAVAVDGQITSRGLLKTVNDDSEIHFLPAIGGGERCL